MPHTYAFGAYLKGSPEFHQIILLVPERFYVVGKLTYCSFGYLLNLKIFRYLASSSLGSVLNFY